eukprot:3438810-Rhodomonas_salina.1
MIRLTSPHICTEGSILQCCWSKLQRFNHRCQYVRRQSRCPKSIAEVRFGAGALRRELFQQIGQVQDILVVRAVNWSEGVNGDSLASSCSSRTGSLRTWSPSGMPPPTTGNPEEEGEQDEKLRLDWRTLNRCEYLTTADGGGCGRSSM